ncbi:MAG: SAM-dependent chlorinase/fluorinase [Thermoplasmata archaeon]|nr:SAM-dependent chlorinase/fluorinase [Thermoplasmata archaeon]MCI4356913.1 SAM-dependent chlorinase/fluorinase [Thermoplasmata archaeon]
MARRQFVTLTTDIGWAYAAQIKAVFARRAPNASLVDVAHDVPRHAIRPAAFLLAHIAPLFPPGSVHLVVVDPGVGGSRAPVAVETEDGSFFVGPDNGVLGLAVRALGEKRTVRLTPPDRPPTGRRSVTFDGRDVFAPAAARLANGASLTRLGRAHRLHQLVWPRPQLDDRSSRGEVLHVDVFGNAITNLPGDAVPPTAQRLVLRVRNRVVPRVSVRRTYEEIPTGGVALLASSFGLLEIAERNGSAAERLRLAPGDSVSLAWWRPRSGAGK